MPPERPSRRPALTWIALALAGAAAAVQLLVSPVVGLADNGDFRKVMKPVGIAYRPESPPTYFSWIETRFAIVPPDAGGLEFLSSESLVAAAARRVNRLLVSRSVFDLRVLGTLHLALFIGGVGLLVTASSAVPWPARAAGAALLVLAFTDVGYVAPFNSFYTQTASLLFLLLTAGAACLAATRRGPAPLQLVAYFVFAALFVGSKPQESLHGPILAAFGVLLAVTSGAGRRERAISWILAAALCGFSVWYFRSSAPEYRRLAKFNAVFLELVPSSPTPARDLQDLGMDPAWAAFALRPAYPEGLRLEALDELGYGRLLRFYLARPARFASLVRRAAPSAFELRPQALGNFEKSTGRPPRAKSERFAVWSGLRRRLAPVAVAALLVLAGAAAASAAWPVRAASPSDRIARAGIVAVAAMAAIEFFVCILADALFGLPRHLYLFQALTDLLLIGIVVRAIALWVSRPRRLAGARA